MIRGGVVLAAALCILSPGASAQDASWTLGPDLRIGSLDRPDYSLTRISDLEVGPDGRIYVAQPTERLIRVYGADGSFLRAIGRAGAGPGEFERVDTLGYTPRGVLALDRARGRLSLFGFDGSYVESWRAPAHDFGVGMLGTPPRARLRDGSVLVMPGYQKAPGEQFRQLPVLQFDSAGELRRTLALLTVGDQSRRAQAGTLVSVIPQPVSSHTLWAVPRDGDGIVLVHRAFGSADRAGSFHLIRIAASGDTALSRRYEVPVRRIPRDEVADTIAAIVDHIARNRPFPRAQIEALYEDGWRLPEFQAPVDRVIAAIDGSIWLREGAFLADNATWTVLDARGELIGRLRVPAGLTILRAGRDHVWGVRHGEFDEPYVVRMSIIR